jgi:hypothetical protein
MIDLWIIAILSLGCGFVVFFSVRKILIDAAGDDVNFPLTSCDTSMYDEIREEPKNIDKEPVEFSEKLIVEEGSS